MDLEFREPTEEEKDYVIEKSLQYDSANEAEVKGDTRLSQSDIYKMVFVAIIVWLAMILIMIFKGINSDLPIFITAIGTGLFAWWFGQVRKKESKSTYATYSKEKAHLFVADVVLTKSELIKTDTGTAYYIEVTDKNSIIGKTAELHVSKVQYDSFVEGREAYIAKWDFVNNHDGQDMCELIIR